MVVFAARYKAIKCPLFSKHELDIGTVIDATVGSADNVSLE